MRAHEFLKESATAGATGSGSVATVVQPVGGKKRRADQFFGGDPNASIYSNTPVAVIRRPSPTAEAGKNKKGKKKAGD